MGTSTPPIVRINELEEFARRVVRYAGCIGDDYLADQARAVLGDLEYGRPLACPPRTKIDPDAMGYVRVGHYGWGPAVVAAGLVLGVILMGVMR